MKIAIVGAGASGIFCAISRKLQFPLDEVILIDKEERIGKKIYATGNGRCNLLHEMTSDFCDHYNQPLFVKKVFDKVDLTKLITIFSSLGLDLKKEGELYYPRTDSAKTVMDIFKYWIQKLGILVLSKEEMVDYHLEENQVIVTLKNKKIIVDHLVLACGGKSSPQLGSSGNIFLVLKKHGYSISSLYPGLVGIHLQEDVSSLKGQRIKAKVSLYENQQCIYQETGEVQWKEDGVSGIVIMNISSYLARKNLPPSSFDLGFDFLPEFTKEEAFTHFKRKEEQGYPYLDGTLISPLARFLEARTKTKGKKNDSELLSVLSEAKNSLFHIRDLYPFSSSQVTVGGVKLDEVDAFFSSKKEKNVSIIGETLDIDGFCGGYNLMWAWASAYIASHFESEGLE